MDTYPRLRNCLVVGIILLFAGMVVAPNINFSVVKASYDDDFILEGVEYTQKIDSNECSSKGFPWFTFKTYLIIEYDEEYVNQTTFTPGCAYLIPISIGYRADVPDWILHSLPWPLNWWYLYHSIIAPMMIINLSVENVPNWTHIYITSSSIIMNIDNEFNMGRTDVLVSIPYYAPLGSFTFSVIAEAPGVHRINGCSMSRNITLTVQ